MRQFCTAWAYPAGRTCCAAATPLVCGHESCHGFDDDDAAGAAPRPATPAAASCVRAQRQGTQGRAGVQGGTGQERGGGGRRRVRQWARHPGACGAATHRLDVRADRDRGGWPLGTRQAGSVPCRAWPHTSRRCGAVWCGVRANHHVVVHWRVTVLAEWQWPGLTRRGICATTADVCAHRRSGCVWPSVRCKPHNTVQLCGKVGPSVAVSETQ